MKAVLRWGLLFIVSAATGCAPLMKVEFPASSRNTKEILVHGRADFGGFLSPGNWYRGNLHLHSTISEIEGHLSFLIENHFPALRQTRIELRRAATDDRSVFLETDVDRSTLLRSARKRRYLIYVSDRLGEDGPGERALRAILVHELCHIEDYSDMSLWGLIKLNGKYSRDLDFQIAYERQTDLKTMQLGFAEGLKAYRTWLYGVMDSAGDIRLKKQAYFTPEEIDVWMRENPQSAGARGS